MLRILQWLPSLLSLLQGLQGRSGPGPNFWLYFMPLSFSVAKQQTHRVSSYSLQHQVTSHCTAVRKPFPLLECLLSPTGTPSTCLLLCIQAQPNHHFLREASLTYTGALFTTCTAAHLIRAPAIPQSWIAATASEKRIPRCCLASYRLSSAQPDGLFKTGPHVSHGSQSSNGSSSHFEQNLHSSDQTFQGLASAHLPASFLPDLLLIKN